MASIDHRLRLSHTVIRRLWVGFFSCVTAAAAAAGADEHAGGGFLEVRGTRLFLEDKPFAEISFNKFDLFWQLLAAEHERPGFGPQPAARAEKALRELHEFGFKTIRVFCATGAMDRDYFDPAAQPRFHAAMDRMLDLCDRHELRVVFCLATTNNLRAPDESSWQAVADPKSCSRVRIETFVDDMVTRYRNRTTVAIWEIANELLLEADIGGRSQLWGEEKVPNLQEVVAYHRAIAERIRRLDRRHPISTGDSYRNNLWHLSEHAKGRTENPWQTDSLEQLGEAVSRPQRAADVFSIHAYYFGRPHGVHAIRRLDGGLEAFELVAWTRIAHQLEMPLYVGEYGVLPRSRTEAHAEQFRNNPEWPVSLTEDPEATERVYREALDRLVGARPNLAHVWAYQSDRDQDRGDEQRADLDLERTPNLVRAVVEANRQLQQATIGFTYAPESHPPAITPQ